MVVTFTACLVSKLDFGHVLVFSGKSIEKANSVYVNLETKPQPTANVAIRALFDFDHNQVIRYIKTNKGWQNEETKQNMEPGAPDIPKPGKRFKIAFFCDEDKYRIWVEDKPYCHYDYFISLQEVVSVELGSSGLDQVYQVDHRRVFPSPWPLIQYDEKDLEFSHEIPAPIKVNTQMTLEGWTKGNNTGGFILYLRNGQNGQKSLYFRVYFDTKKIVRSAMKDPCSNGPEYSDGPFPFKFGENFKIAIGFLKDRFIFGVNGQRIPDFKYTEKNTLDSLTSVKIWGRGHTEVIIQDVKHLALTEKDCIDYNFEIYCEKPKANKLLKAYGQGDTEDEDDDDEDCTDDSEYNSDSLSSGLSAQKRIN